MRSNSYDLDPDVYVPGSTERYCDSNTGKFASALKFSKSLHSHFTISQMRKLRHRKMK